MFRGSQEPDNIVFVQKSADRSLSSIFQNGQSRTTNLILTVFLSLFAEGRIPESLGNLGKLQDLDLKNNNLEGFFFIFGMVGPVRPT